MNYQEMMLRKRTESAKEFLSLAMEQIDMIRNENRTPDTDRMLNESADAIYEAKEKLEGIETDQFIGHVGERVVATMRHRKKKKES